MEIFIILRSHWNPFDFGLLEHLVSVFGTDDLRQAMTRYKLDLEKFEKKTTVQQFQDARGRSIDSPDNYSVIVTKLKKAHGSVHFGKFGAL